MCTRSTKHVLYRDNDVGRLSVMELQEGTVTIYASGTGSVNNSSIPIMDEIYVGGAPSMMVNQNTKFKIPIKNLLLFYRLTAVFQVNNSQDV